MDKKKKEEVQVTQMQTNTVNKRKRENEEVDYRTIRRKVEEQRKIIEEEERNSIQANKELYGLFNSLQGTAKE